jgi:hypothetical protein
MIKLRIASNTGYLYELEDESNKKYSLNLEFFDLEEPLKVGNQIIMNYELLNPNYEGYSSNYTFGNLDNKYGRANLSLDDIDVIRVVQEDKEIYLKRLYG